MQSDCNKVNAKLHFSPSVEEEKSQASVQSVMYVHCMSSALTYGAIFSHEKGNSGVILLETRSAKTEQQYKSTIKSQEHNKLHRTPCTLSVTEFSTFTDLSLVLQMQYVTRHHNTP